LFGSRYNTVFIEQFANFSEKAIRAMGTTKIKLLLDFHTKTPTTK